MASPVITERGSAIHSFLRLLAACLVVVVGVIAAQLIMQRFELGSGAGGTAPSGPPAAPEITATGDAEGAPVPAASAPPEPEMDLAPSAPASSDSFPYQVQATFISDPPTFSRALLRGPDGQSKWYLTGQQPESGLVLKEIQKDRVVFDYRGEERVQRLKRDAEEAPPAQASFRGADAPLPQPYTPAAAPPLPTAAPAAAAPARAEAEPAAPAR